MTDAGAPTARQRVQPWRITGLGARPAAVETPTGVLRLRPSGCFVVVSPEIVTPMPLDRSGRPYEDTR